MDGIEWIFETSWAFFSSGPRYCLFLSQFIRAMCKGRVHVLLIHPYYLNFHFWCCALKTSCDLSPNFYVIRCMVMYCVWHVQMCNCVSAPCYDAIGPGASIGGMCATRCSGSLAVRYTFFFPIKWWSSLLELWKAVSGRISCLFCLNGEYAHENHTCICKCIHMFVNMLIECLSFVVHPCVCLCAYCMHALCLKIRQYSCMLICLQI